MRINKTNYKLLNVSNGHEFEDKGWTLTDPEGKAPSLVRAVYEKKNFAPRAELDGIYRNLYETQFRKIITMENNK